MTPKKSITNKKTDSTKLRHEAEAKLHARKEKTKTPAPTEADALHLLHELEVHQIELAKQNEELNQARVELEASLDQYTNLYDFAPVGYFTLARDGQILKTNLIGANLLGVERDKLIKRRFGLFVSVESRPIFRAFLEKIFEGQGKEICEVALLKDGSEPLWAKIEAKYSRELDECNTVVMDITERKRAEEKLGASEQVLKLFVDYAPAAIAMFDRDMKYIAASRRYFADYQLTEQDIIGRSHYEVLPEIPERWKEIHRRCLAGASDKAEEDPFPRADGTMDWVRWEIRPWREVSGEIGGIILFSEVVTERKQAEAALRESEERFRHAVIGSPTPMLIHDEDDKVLALSKGWTNFSGYTLDDIPTMSDWTRNAYGESSKTAKEYINKLFEINETVSNGEWVINTKTGEKRTWNFYTTPIGISRNGKRILLSQAFDITERKQAQEKLARANQLLENTGRLGKIGGWEVDLNTMETYFSTETFNIYELPGPTPPKVEDGINFYAPESRPVIQLAVKNAIEKHIPYDLELPFITAKGKNLWVRTQGHVEVKDGQAVRLYGIFQDITEHKMAENIIQNHAVELEHRVQERTAELNKLNLELQHANRIKNEFLATMSHELRTPLNSILGLSEVLLEQNRDPLSARQQKSLGIIESSGHHLLELINDILDVSKIEAGKFDVYPEVIDVNALCRSSLTFVKEQAVKKSITLDYTENKAISKIHADPRRMKQVLVNLLNNAVKFTPAHGRVTLQVRADEEHDLVQFSVTDTGIGIASEDLKRLFNPFVQVDSRLSREYEGTGLGLALVQRLTDLHGGSIQVQSEVGKGSTFTVSLPWGLNIIAEQKDTKPSDPSLDDIGEENVLKNSSARGKILLAEDTLSNILTVSEYLGIHGYEVLVAHDGLEAVDLAEKNDPDIILMDIQMPVMDGLEAIIRLRADSRFASTPIIALTALAMPGDRERCLKAGANEYMSKPVSLKLLLKTINERLAQ